MYMYVVYICVENFWKIKTGLKKKQYCESVMKN